MPDSDARFDFEHFCATFARWFFSHGFSQGKLAGRGGPSKPKIKALLDGTWTSTRPTEITTATDIGFGWREGTAWRVLTEHHEPTEDDLVSGPAQTPGQYVGATGERVVEGRREDSEVLQAIAAMSARFDQLDAGQRDLSSSVASLAEHTDSRFAAVEDAQRELSRRLAQFEEPRT